MDRTGCVLIYAVVLVVGATVIYARREPPLQWTAARTLNPGDLLRAGDAAPGAGQFIVRRTVEQGEEIVRSSVASASGQAIRDDEIVFAASVKLTSGLKVGDTARACANGKSLDDVSLRQLLCAEPASVCRGAASIPFARARELGEFLAAGASPTLEPTKSPACK